MSKGPKIYKSTGELDDLFDWAEDLVMSESGIEELDVFLEGIYVPMWKTLFLASLLAITLPHSAKFKNRKDFFKRVRTLLYCRCQTDEKGNFDRSKGVPRAQKLLEGLE